MLAVFIDSNAAATVAGISELVAQLTINADVRAGVGGLGDAWSPDAFGVARRKGFAIVVFAFENGEVVGEGFVDEVGPTVGGAGDVADGGDGILAVFGLGAVDETNSCFVSAGTRVVVFCSSPRATGPDWVSARVAASRATSTPCSTRFGSRRLRRSTGLLASPGSRVTLIRRSFRRVLEHVPP
ncbi:hypothetical protein Rwratislav_16752 [Rhodococcus wratislaviensis IFP 2016]|nr:hypothetical protein Rwratislav_16752 [Rhodococcus wratislaviensis IFP 2016]